MPYYHLTYYRDFLTRIGQDPLTGQPATAPFRDIEIVLAVYDTPAFVCRAASVQNTLCDATERFRVYESPGKKLSRKSTLYQQ